MAKQVNYYKVVSLPASLQPSSFYFGKGASESAFKMWLTTDATTPVAIPLNAVPLERTITAGTGLTGGGDLSSNKTLSLDVAYTDGRFARLDFDNTFTKHNHFDNAISIPNIAPTGAHGNRTYLHFGALGTGSETPPLVANLTDLQDVNITAGDQSTDGVVSWSASLGKFVLGNSVAGYIPLSQKGQANGVATLGADGLIPAIQLPSYVDDVVEVANYAALPATGEAGKIYVVLTGGSDGQGSFPANSQFRWTGTAYVRLVASPGTTDNVVEGANNLYFTVARARAAISAGSGINYSAGALSVNRSVTDTWYEPFIGSKGSAFNKNFGTTAGTVAEGNDTRINNGQAAYTAIQDTEEVETLDFESSDFTYTGHNHFDVAISIPNVAPVGAHAGKTYLHFGAIGSGGTQPPLVANLSDLQDVTIIGATSGQVLQWNGSKWINSTVPLDLSGYVLKSTSVIAGTGLTGGGTLAADRTLSVSFGTAANTVAMGNHTHAFASLTAKPTNVLGYGITDAVTTSGNQWITGVKSFFRLVAGVNSSNIPDAVNVENGSVITTQPVAYTQGLLSTTSLDVRAPNGSGMLYPLHVSGYGNGAAGRGVGIQFNVASTGVQSKSLGRIFFDPAYFGISWNAGTTWSDPIFKILPTGRIESILDGTSADWKAAFDWGNHSLGGYAKLAGVETFTGKKTFSVGLASSIDAVLGSDLPRLSQVTTLITNATSWSQEAW